MNGGVVAATAVAALYALHRLALWSEARGYVHYRLRRGSSGAIGNAFLTVQAILEPSKRHVLEERQKDDSEDDESGDPPTA